MAVAVKFGGSQATWPRIGFYASSILVEPTVHAAIPHTKAKLPISIARTWIHQLLPDVSSELSRCPGQEQRAAQGEPVSQPASGAFRVERCGLQLDSLPGTSRLKTILKEGPET